MSHQSKLSAVLKKCREACPELMENHCAGGFFECYCQKCDTAIGHPVRLSHLLRTIHATLDPTHRWIEMDEMGEMRLFSMPNDRPEEVIKRCYYHLTKDNLEEQSEELVAFIHSVLFPE